MKKLATENLLIGAHEDGELPIKRSQAASEVVAAVAHQLSGPLTALLLYVGDINLACDRLPIDENERRSLKTTAEHALHEAERACALIQQIAEACATPLPGAIALADGRDIIAWWSRTTAAAGRATDVDPVAANASYRLLTPREQEVLQLISQGLTNKEGALRLNIGPRTFESHRARIMRKFKAKNAAGLVRMVLQVDQTGDGSRTRPAASPEPCHANSEAAE
jgi:DNA-binding CsgD family transcriptional regulator